MTKIIDNLFEEFVSQIRSDETPSPDSFIKLVMEIVCHHLDVSPEIEIPEPVIHLGWS